MKKTHLTVIVMTSVLLFISGCTTLAQPQPHKPINKTFGTLSHSCAPWDGAVIQLDLLQNNPKPFPHTNSMIK